jgi:hypothetical protein
MCVSISSQALAQSLVTTLYESPLVPVRGASDGVSRAAAGRCHMRGLCYIARKCLSLEMCCTDG